MKYLSNISNINTSDENGTEKEKANHENIYTEPARVQPPLITNPQSTKLCFQPGRK